MRKQCHTSAQLTDAEVKGSGLPTTDFASTPLSGCKEPHTYIRLSTMLSAASQLITPTKTGLGNSRK
jgi:hypothetical protein